MYKLGLKTIVVQNISLFLNAQKDNKRFWDDLLKMLMFKNRNNLPHRESDLMNTDTNKQYLVVKSVFIWHYNQNRLTCGHGSCYIGEG